ncbi:MAG: PSD1 and planctomycete cytochrome C domain-containing protein [Planctomycetota bacterium]|jgi:hypothetical protein
MLRPSSLALLALVIFLDLGRTQDRSAHGADFDFNRDIRPILSENCFYCHGQDGKKREAGLRLDTRQEAVDSGAIVPGDVSASELIERILSDDPETLMPPPRSNRRLTPEQKQRLQDWIAAGAPYSNHWAFDPPRSTPPPLAGSQWAASPADAFIAAGHQHQGLTPQPSAPRHTLIKRLYVDLIGAPPEPEEVTRFVESQDPLAYERLVDSLLADPGYGQRMALPWLDAARYADSNGFQQDGDTWQWLWRDWIVRAMNENLPFDQFTIWQLAGDLLPDATIDQKIASGFNRNHLLNGEGGAIAEEQRFVILFDRIDTTCTTWLGLTMACAQCHDHKYDPMTMRDYYSLMDAFNRVPESGVPQYFSSRIRVAPPLIELPTPENERRIAEYEQRIEKLRQESQPLVDAAYLGWRAGAGAAIPGLPDPIAAILQKRDEERTEEEKNQFEKGLRQHFDEKVLSGLNAKLPILGQLQAVRNELASYRADQIPRPMIMSDAQPRETRMLDRGEYLKPLDPVTFTTPAFLPPMAEGAPRNRLGLAMWLVAPEHPLTARVQVNRMWQHFFGMGIVKTAEDFGVQSEYPVHGALLDYLAVQYRESGWDSKRMHRDMITSATYMQSSKATAEGRTKDPENRWFARGGRFRMPALLLRDWALSAAALIDRRVGGAPVYPYQPDGIWESLAITKERDFTYPNSQGADLYRRSLYTFWRRTVGPANMFDTSNRQACRVRQSQTSTPLHALTTLNDPTWVEAARELAQRCLEDSPDIEHQLRTAFTRVMAREPSTDELSLLFRAYQKHRAIYESDRDAANRLLGVGAKARNSQLDSVAHAAMTNVCLTMLNLDEALTRE